MAIMGILIVSCSCTQEGQCTESEQPQQAAAARHAARKPCPCHRAAARATMCVQQHTTQHMCRPQRVAAVARLRTSSAHSVPEWSVSNRLNTSCEEGGYV